MSVDPAAVSASTSAANAAAVEAMIQSEIDALAADAQALQAQVKTGQVVTAQVLPSNGMTDLISILGNRVAAQLPPTVYPGDTFTAQVTGFDGPRILLQIISTVEPPVTSGAPPPPPVTAAPAPPPTPLQAAATQPLPPGVESSLAPPPAVFVAASVRPAPDVALTAPPPAQAPPQQSVVLADIEARLAAARTGQVTVNVPTSAPLQPPPVPSPIASAQPQPAQPQPATEASSPPPAAPAVPTPQTPVPVNIPGRFTLPPSIQNSPRFADPVGANADAGAQAPVTQADFREPLPLVRALGLPVTPTNLAAAKLALSTPQRLPAALATLESALPDVDDSRVQTLRALTAFIGKIDPQSPQLAAQISAYVDNVVTGNEPKLAQLLTAQLTSDQFANQPAPPPAATATTAANAQPTPPAAPVPTLPVVALAQIVARSAALNVDLKTQILSLVNGPPAVDAPDFVPAASAALSAITAVQMNAAQAMAASPQTMSFTIPMFLGQGYGQAQIAVDRDAKQPDGRSRSLDGDNFHIAFVLTTKNLGIVTVDLQTVGRAFSLSVKTENEKSAATFGDKLATLTDRLQTLRYTVNSAEASVAGRGAATPLPVPAEPVDDGVQSDVNVRV